MLGTQNLSAFLVASFLLWITPGTDTMYILTQSIAQGRKAGLISALGISSGILVHTVFAAFGLSTILSTSAWAFVSFHNQFGEHSRPPVAKARANQIRAFTTGIDFSVAQNYSLKPIVV